MTPSPASTAETRRASVTRIVVTMLIALAVSVGSVFAGIWQWGRYEDRAQAVRDFAAAASAPVTDWADAVDLSTGQLRPGGEWRTVSVDGRFDPDSMILLRNRPVDGMGSLQFLGWFESTDGPSLLVNAGWMPQPGPTEDPEWPEFPAGDLTLTVVLRTLEPDDGRRDSGATRIVVEQMGEAPSQPVEAYGTLREACGEAGCTEALVNEVPLPELTEGPHLAYAFQWWAFAVLAPVGALLLLRREREDGAGPDAERPSRRRVSSGPSDEEIEDAL